MKCDIIVNCSPSLGILDQWLPILVEIKKDNPKIKIIFYAPQPEVLYHLNSKMQSSVLIRISNDIFNRVSFTSDSGRILYANSFNDAKKLYDKAFFYPVVALIKILKKLRLYYLSKVLRKVYSKIIKILFKKHLFSFSKSLIEDAIILCDITMKHEIYNKIFYERLSSNKKYSILHGVGVYGVRGGAAKYHIINNTVVYLFSEREREFYKNFFSIDSELLRQYGIPKHEKKWINYILTQECKDDKLIPFDNYIFIISRPSGRSVPYDRKIEYIHDIKLIAKKYNYKIIVKKHPRGAEDGSFEQILGSDEYGVFWAYSNAHAYLLGAHCSLSISFYSGVPVDLIALGVPTIERLDLNDLPGYKEHKLTMSGIPVTEQRYFGLVLGASNYNQLEEHVKDIISNKSKIVNKLKNNYNKLYPQIKDINRVISKEIISSDTVIPKKNNT